MTTEQMPEHHGQHDNTCGKCNGWRYDRAVERKAAIARGEDPNRVVAPDDEWNWRKAGEAEATEADAKWATKVLERGFKGSQAAFINGIATPGQVSITNFIVGMLLARERPDFARRILGGIEKGASIADGRPAEFFEQEMRKSARELIESLEKDT